MESIERQNLDLNKKSLWINKKILVIEVCGFAGVIVTMLFTIYQIKKTTDVFRLQALRDRFELFMYTENPVTDGELAILKSIPEEYLEKDTYESKYYMTDKEGNRVVDDEKLKRLLLRARQYHVLLYAHTAEQHHEDLLSVNLDTWAKELVKVDEFRDFHERQKHYYPEFCGYLKAFITDTDSLCPEQQMSQSGVGSLGLTDRNALDNVSLVSQLVMLALVALGVVVAIRRSQVAINHLKKVESSFGLQTLGDRFQAYGASELPITDEYLATAKLAIIDYMETSIYERRYQHDDEKFRRYLMMLRRYHYALYSWLAEKRFSQATEFGLDKWLEELCEIEEFREVHYRYGMYYPEFAAYIDGLLRRSEFWHQQTEAYTKYKDDDSYRAAITFALEDIQGRSATSKELSEEQFKELWNKYPEVFDVQRDDYRLLSFLRQLQAGDFSECTRKLSRQKVHVKDLSFWDSRWRYLGEPKIASTVDRYMPDLYGAEPLLSASGEST